MSSVYLLGVIRKSLSCFFLSKVRLKERKGADRVSICDFFICCDPSLQPYLEVSPLFCLGGGATETRRVCVCACASFYCHFISLEPRGKSKSFSSGPVKGRASGADQRRFRRHCCSLAGGSAARARWRTGAGAGAW